MREKSRSLPTGSEPSVAPQTPLGMTVALRVWPPGAGLKPGLYKGGLEARLQH
jgi:hypothetical protein